MKNILSRETQFNQSLVTVIVSNMQRSIDFYTNRLGLALKARYGDEFALVEAPGITIGLHPAREGGAKPGALSIGLGVDDIEASRKQLQDHGVEFSGDIVADPPMRLAFFRDPDGVEIYLAEQSEWT